MLFFLTFMYIFNFIPFMNMPIIKSNMIVAIILFIKVLTNRNYRKSLCYVLKQNYIKNILLVLLYIICYSIFITSVMGEYDFTIIKTFINQFISLIIGCMIYSLYKFYNKEEYIIDYLIYCFFLQSVIQIGCFFSLEFNDLISIFRPESVTEIGKERYAGIRGLAMSTYGFFSLACAYAIIYILFFKNWNEFLNGKTLIKLLILVVLIFGGLSSARSSIIGLLIGILLLIIDKFTKLEIKFKIKYSLKYILFIQLIILIVFVLLIFNKDANISSDIIYKINRFKEFVFEMFYNLSSSNELKVSSLNTLFNDMYFYIDEETFIFGDGRYIDTMGGYYMNTDAGYMRNILFFGIIGFIFLLIYQLMFLKLGKKNKLLALCLISCILILHIKGDILGFSIISQSILILILLRFKNMKT